MSDATAAPDADPSVCEPDELRYAYMEGTFGLGDHCDQIQLCTSKDGAESVSAVAPGFECEESPCGDDDYACVWLNPDTVDESEWAQLCAVTVLEEGPEEVLCAIFL